MLNKKLMLLAIFFVSLLAVSAVSAADNLTDEVNSIADDETCECVNLEDVTSCYNESDINSDCVSNNELVNCIDDGEDQLKDDEGKPVHFDISNTFYSSLTVYLKDSKGAVIKNAQIRYSFDYGDVQTVYSGKDITVPNSLESNCYHALTLEYKKDYYNQEYANCNQLFFFYKAKDGKCTLSDTGPVKTLFKVPSTTVYGSLLVNLVDADGNNLDDQIFNYYFDGDDNNQYSASNGRILLNLTPDTTHNVTFVYNGKKSKYMPAKGTIKVTYHSSIIIKDDEKYYVEGGMMIPYSYYSQKKWNSGNYFAKFGTTFISLRNAETGETVQKNVTIIKRILQTDDLNVSYQDTIEYRIRAANEKNVFTSGLQVKIVINGISYSASTDSRGYAAVNVHLPAGVYDVVTSYCGVVNRNKINITPVYVDNVFKDIYINSVTTTPAVHKDVIYGWKGNFKGLLQICKGSSLIKNIDLDTSGFIGDYFTYDNHSYAFSTSLLDLGDYDFKIMDKNGSIVAQSKVTVRKIPTEVYSFNTEVIRNYKESISIYLKEKSSNEGLDGKVKVTVNGKTYNVKIKDGYGELSFKTPSKLKKYKCTVSYGGDGNYASSSSRFTLSVVKDDRDVLVSDLIKTKADSKITLKAKIYHKYGTKKVKSGIVKFKINGKTYKVKVKKGIAKLKIKTPSKAGTYKCKVTFLGDKYTKKSSAKFKIIVKKPAVKKKTKKRSSGKKFTLKLTKPEKTTGKTIRGNHIYAFYKYRSQGQYARGVCVDSYGKQGPGTLKGIKLTKAKIYFKNNYNGKTKVKTKKFDKYGYTRSDLISGYTPYKVVVYYK